MMVSAFDRPTSTGDQVKLDSDLPSAAKARKARLIEAMEQLCEFMESGQAPDRNALLETYSDVADELVGCLDNLDFLQNVAPQLAEDPERPAAAKETPIQPQMSLGDFQIVRELGRGGMGVVYEAEQLSIGRLVALKVLPFAALLDKQQLNRFKNEARAAGTLNHPNIVSVFSVGTERGVHYYAMQLIEGQSLAEVIADLRKCQRIDEAARGDGHPITVAAQGLQAPLTEGAPAPPDQLPSDQVASPTADTKRDVQAAISTAPDFDTEAYFRSVARLGAQAAEALDHAHQNGIVHRDVKPGNLLVDASDRLWVTDFGLARIEADAGMTMTGDLLGTLRYMSPEQALAKRVVIDHRTDVYSLGATLYELLSLEPAYAGSDREELLKQIVFEDPRWLRQLNTHIPVDLETIVAKAMEKTPEDRYDTAQDLADDLRRFTNDEPIKAKRGGPLAGLQKWSRRHRAVVRSAAAILVLAVVGSTLSTALILGAYRSEALARSQAEQAADRAEDAAETAEKERGKAVAARARETAAREESESNLYVAQMRMAQQDFSAGQIRRLHEILDNHLPAADKRDLRDWEWYYFLSECHRDLFTMRGHVESVRAVVWSADGKRLASASDDHTVKIWNAATGRVVRTLTGHNGNVSSIAWSPDGKRLVSGDWHGRIEIWDPLTGARVRGMWHDSDNMKSVDSVAWNPAGDRFASASSDATIKIWDAATGQELHTLRGQTDVKSVAWAPDGVRLASVEGGDESVRIWNAATGEPLLTLDEHSAGVFSVAWSPDSTRLASAGRTVKIWDATTGENVLSTGESHPPWLSVTWNPNGKQLALSAADGGLVKILDAATGAEVGRFWGHCASSTNSVAWSPDGERLASASSDHTIKVWDANGVQAPHARHDRPIHSVAWSPDGTRLALVSEEDRTVKIWDAATRQEVLTLGGHTNVVYSTAWSHDGTRLATGSRDQTAKIWNALSGKELFTLQGHTHDLRDVAWSPDSTRLASASIDGTVKIWDAAAGREISTLKVIDWGVQSVDWSPSGQHLASASIAWQGRRGTVAIWDAATGKKLRTLPGPPGEFAEVAWSPDSSRLAAGSTESVLVWDVVTGEVVRPLHGHVRGRISLTWSPDGCRLASTNLHDSIKLWDAKSGQEIVSLLGAKGGIYRTVAWGPEEGHRLVAAGSDGGKGILTIWDITRGVEFAKSRDYKFDMASRLTLSGRREEAQQILRKLVEELPDRSDFRVALAEAYHDEFYEHFRDSDSFALTGTVNKQRLQQANVALDQAIRLIPDNSELIRDRGAIHYERGEFDAAIGDFSEAIRLEPRNAEAHYIRGKAYHEKGEFDKAIDDYTEAIRLYPQIPHNYWARAEAYGEKREFDKAIDDCSETIRLRPSASSYGNRGWAYDLKGEFDKAIDDLSEAIERDPMPAQRLLLRSRTYRKMSEFDKAIADCNKALQLEPQNDNAYSHRGNVYLRKGEFDKAIADFSEAIRLNPRYWGYYNDRGWAFVGKSEFDTAIADFSKAIQINPSGAALYNRRGHLYAAQGELDRAIHDFEQETSLGQPLPNYLRAVALLATGDRDGYRQACASMQQKYGETNDAKTAYWVARTCILIPRAIENPDQVVQLAKKAVAGEQQPLGVATLGGALYRAGQYEQAIERLSDPPPQGLEGVRARLSLAYICFFRAMVHHRLGNHKEANEAFEKAVESMDSVIHERGLVRDAFNRWHRRLTLGLLRAEAAQLLGVTETGAQEKDQPTE